MNVLAKAAKCLLQQQERGVFHDTAICIGMAGCIRRRRRHGAESFETILRPPAPSFESIAQRSSITADSVQTFLNTTHRDIGNPKGMPNPQLLDYQIKQIAAYLMSLRKQS
jgi:cytochrome c1